LVSPGIPDQVSPSDGAHIGIVPQARGSVGASAAGADGPLGKCGRGNVGDQYVCTNGAVLRYDQIQHFLEAF